MVIGVSTGVSCDDGQHLLSTQCVPTAMQDRYYPHFTDEEAEVPGGQVNHPNLQRHNQCEA